MVSKRPTRRVPAQPREEPEVEDEVSGNGEEAPAKRVKSAGGNDGIRGGWTEGQRQMDSTSKFAQTLRPEEKSQVIKFLDDSPYANFKRHWIKRRTKDGETNRPYTCPRTFDNDKPCPLCEAGDKPQAVAAFNVALVGDDGQVLLKSFDTTPRTFNQLKGYSNDRKIGPLTKGYFLVNKTGERGTSFTGVHPVAASSLEEDYDTTPPDQAELDRLERYDPSIIDPVDMKTLRELAEEIVDEYE